MNNNNLKLFLPPLAAAVKVADVRLTHDGNGGLLICALVAGGGSGGNGQDCGNEELIITKRNENGYPSRLRYGVNSRGNVYQFHVDFGGSVE